MIARFKVESLYDLSLHQLRGKMIKFSFKYSFLDENNDIIYHDEEDEFHASDIMDGNNSIFLSINPFEIPT
jgi:hypothetical protein